MTLSCPLCGYGFDEAEMAAVGCRTCPASPAGCGLVKCPACGYEWPPEGRSALVKVLKRLFGKKEKEAVS